MAIWNGPYISPQSQTQNQTNSILWLRTWTLLCRWDSFFVMVSSIKLNQSGAIGVHTTRGIYLRESDFYEIVHVIWQKYGDGPHIIAIIFMTWTEYACNLGQKRTKYACNDNNNEHLKWMQYQFPRWLRLQSARTWIYEIRRKIIATWLQDDSRHCKRIWSMS